MIFRVRDLGFSFSALRFPHTGKYTYVNKRALARARVCAFGFNLRSAKVYPIYRYIYLSVYLRIILYTHIKHARVLASTHGPRHIFKRAADIA